MKYFVIFLILIGLIIPQAFATEEIIHGRSSFELLPSEIITDKPISFEIVFMYYDHPYSIESLSPIIEINPSSALSNVHIEIEPISVYPGQIFRIPVNMTINSEIEHKKIFLTLSFIGNNPKTNTVYKSGWTESAIIDVIQNDVNSEKLPSSQDYEFERLTGARCDGEPALCYGTFYNGTTIPVQCDYRHSCGVIPFDNDVFYQSPLKQFKSGIAIDQIQCKEGFAVAIKKSNGNPGCVKRETLEKLRERGWAEPLGDIIFQRPSQSKPESDDTLSESDYDPHSPRCGSGIVPYIPENWQTTGMHPSDETWEALGNYLMKQEFYKELQSRNIVFEPVCFGAYTGMVEQSYPPRFSMCSVVTASNGTDIYLEGMVNEFDVIYFDIDNKIPYQCDDNHGGCLCGIENED